jgi:hypothetical protein
MTSLGWLFAPDVLTTVRVLGHTVFERYIWGKVKLNEPIVSARRDWLAYATHVHMRAIPKLLQLILCSHA